MTYMEVSTRSNWKHFRKYAIDVISERLVMISVEDGPWSPSLWRADGEEAKTIIVYMDGKPDNVEGYIDMILEKNQERWKKWSENHDI